MFVWRSGARPTFHLPKRFDSIQHKRLQISPTDSQEAKGAQGEMPCVAPPADRLSEHASDVHHDHRRAPLPEAQECHSSSAIPAGSDRNLGAPESSVNAARPRLAAKPGQRNKVCKDQKRENHNGSFGKRHSSQKQADSSGLEPATAESVSTGLSEPLRFPIPGIPAPFGRTAFD